MNTENHLPSTEEQADPNQLMLDIDSLQDPRVELTAQEEALRLTEEIATQENNPGVSGYATMVGISVPQAYKELADQGGWENVRRAARQDLERRRIDAEKAKRDHAEKVAAFRDRLPVAPDGKLPAKQPAGVDTGRGYRVIDRTAPRPVKTPEEWQAHVGVGGNKPQSTVKTPEAADDTPQSNPEDRVLGEAKQFETTYNGQRILDGAVMEAATGDRTRSMVYSGRDGFFGAIDGSASDRLSDEANKFMIDAGVPADVSAALTQMQELSGKLGELGAESDDLTGAVIGRVFVTAEGSGFAYIQQGKGAGFVRTARGNKIELKPSDDDDPYYPAQIFALEEGDRIVIGTDASADDENDTALEAPTASEAARLLASADTNMEAVAVIDVETLPVAKPEADKPKTTKALELLRAYRGRKGNGGNNDGGHQPDLHERLGLEPGDRIIHYQRIYRTKSAAEIASGVRQSPVLGDTVELEMPGELDEPEIKKPVGDERVRRALGRLASRVFRRNQPAVGPRYANSNIQRLQEMMRTPYNGENSDRQPATRPNPVDDRELVGA